MKNELKMSGIGAILLIVILGFFEDSQANSNFLGQYTLHHWDTKNGLPSDLVLSTYQSSDGFLWLTGYTGLIRFDGVAFTSFTSRNVPFLKSDNIHAVRESSDSTLWITTLNSGLLNYKRGVFRQSIPDLALRAFVAETTTGKMLIAQNSEESPYLLIDTQLGKFHHLSQNEADSLLHLGTFIIEGRTDSEGGIWGRFNAQFTSVGRIANGESEYYTLLVENFDYELIVDLFVDSRDRIWLAATDGLYIREGKHFRKYPMKQPVRFSRHTDKAPKIIIEDQSGGIWIAYANGLAYLAPESEHFEYLPDGHPLRTISVNEIMEDREGNIWLSSLNGLYRLSKGKFTVYSKEEGLGSRTVRGVAALEEGKYVVATDEGLSRITDGVVLPFRIHNPVYQSFIRNVYQVFKDSNQNIWICGGLGMVRISNDGEKVFDARIRFAYEDTENTLWFGIPFQGIAFLNEDDELEYEKFTDVDFSNVFISSIRKLADNSWLVTTFDYGILIIDTDGTSVINDATRELKNVSVFSSYEDEDGLVWLTSSSGLYRYKSGILTRTGYESGMPEISVFNFLPDNFGYIWFPTNKGVMRAKKQEINDYLDNRIGHINWQIFDQGDGMRSRAAVGARHSAISPDGKILIPTFDGLLEIDPGNMITNQLPPPLVIHGFSWNSESLHLDDRQVLPPGNHRIVFEYSALSLTAPGKVVFKFRLTGYDKDWITASGDRRAIYTNLPFGDYTFQVIASNNDGVWNEEGALLSFTITPPWWRTWLAYGFYALLLALLLYTADRYQRRRLIRRERERAKEKELEHAKEIKKAYTELKSTQFQLIQSEKMASLGELTAGIAHEIQNPLNFVNNFSELNKELVQEAKEELAKGDLEETKAILNDLEGNSEKINHHGKRADAIVKGMLQHSRTSTGQKEPTDINALADEYLRLSYHGLRAKDNSFNADFKTDFDPNLPKVNIIPQDIGRVLLNLINNAFYAVNARKLATIGTTSTVETTHALSLPPTKPSTPYKPTVTITTKNHGDHIEIRVADNGNGIPEHIKDKIFQPFFTTKPTGQGTGLGLSLSYDIVKTHGGELKVESEEGEGSEFIIQIPMNGTKKII